MQLSGLPCMDTGMDTGIAMLMVGSMLGEEVYVYGCHLTPFHDLD
jgi:hypothetical protein